MAPFPSTTGPSTGWAAPRSQRAIASPRGDGSDGSAGITQVPPGKSEAGSDSAAQERSYGEARAWYVRAQAGTDPAVRELGHISDGHARTLQRLQRMAWAAGAVALAIAAFFALGGRRARWIPLPAETRIVLPVLAVLALLSTRVDPAPRAAVLTLCAGGALLSLLSGARLRALGAGRAARLTHALLGLLALACVAYVAVYRADLIGMVKETFRIGPE